jgi:hypothetical protein
MEMKVKVDAYTGEVLDIWLTDERLTTEEDAHGILSLEDVLASIETHGISPLERWENDGSEEMSIIQKKYSNTKSVTYVIRDEIAFHIYVCESIDERKKVYEEFTGEIKMESFVYGTKIIDNVIIFYQGWKKTYDKEWPVRMDQVDKDLSNR